MKIEYEYRGKTIITVAIYTDDAGNPMSSRFGEHMTLYQVSATLKQYRERDRNKR